MGCPYVTSVPPEACAAVLAALAELGITVRRDETVPAPLDEEVYICRRRHARLWLTFAPWDKQPPETFVVLARPPYSILPCRWRDEQRLFDDVLAVVAPYDRHQDRP